MTRAKYLMISSLVIVLSAFLIYFSGIFNQADLADQIDTDQDLPEETEIADQDEPETEANDEQDSDQDRTGGSTSQSIPGSTFEYKVDVKVDGVIKKDQDSRWWEEGLEKNPAPGWLEKN